MQTPLEPDEHVNIFHVRFFFSEWHRKQRLMAPSLGPLCNKGHFVEIIIFGLRVLAMG